MDALIQPAYHTPACADECEQAQTHVRSHGRMHAPRHFTRPHALTNASRHGHMHAPRHGHMRATRHGHMRLGSHERSPCGKDPLRQQGSLPHGERS